MKNKIPAIMIQGTASNSGKSILTAALCRILYEDGLRPYPFKAQNMALNSCVTKNGEEMGRAQAMQAAACKLAPDVRMNPVLLKPIADNGSQVIVMGKAIGYMRVKEYIAYKPKAFQAIKTAYDSLANEAGIMVIEGAGSPAEINLKSHDIVNMAMANYAKAAVLLVADIDRGGVFASIVGTMELLEPEERAMIAGFIINKFRGDQSLLAPAFDFTTKRTGKPFLGVIPWLHEHGLPEEDSVSFKEQGFDNTEKEENDYIDVAIIDLPHINNFTDFDALKNEKCLRLKAIKRNEDLGEPDVIIIPGSKNTPGDMYWLKEKGLANSIIKLSKRKNAPTIIGICGGLQMLGTKITDPLGLELKGECTGLGLLGLHTELKENKTLSQVQAKCIYTNCTVQGYEIHHGLSVIAEKNTKEHLIANAGYTVGWCKNGNNSTDEGFNSKIWGTYIHGLFDDKVCRELIIKGWMLSKGFNYSESNTGNGDYALDQALTKLAKIVRNSLDMKAIYKILNI